MSFSIAFDSARKLVILSPPGATLVFDIPQMKDLKWPMYGNVWECKKPDSGPCCWRTFTRKFERAVRPLSSFPGPLLLELVGSGPPAKSRWYFTPYSGSETLTFQLPYSREDDFTEGRKTRLVPSWPDPSRNRIVDMCGGRYGPGKEVGLSSLVENLMLQWWIG